MVEPTSNPWDVTEDHFPAGGSLAEQLRFLIHYAVLAPSGHNTQPWLFGVSGNSLELFADRTRALPVVDPEDRALTISCGAALFHLRIALRHFRYAGIIKTFPDSKQPDLLARVSLGQNRPPGNEEQLLFAAPGITDGFTLLQCEPQSFLVLGWPAPDGGTMVSWAFVLTKAEHGWTRLIMRVRAGGKYSFQGLPWWVAKRVVPVVHFIMQRKQLLGIARRAESTSLHAAPK